MVRIVSTVNSSHPDPQPPKKPKKPKREYSKKRIGIAIAIFVLGICLLVVGNFGHVQGFFSQMLQGQVTGTAKNNKQTSKPNYNYSKVKPVSPATLARAYQRRSQYKAVGQIAIPSLNINLNIYRGVGNDELNLGAGSMLPKQKMGHGNYCLAAHNMDDNKSYFSPIYTVMARKGKLVGRYVYLMDYYHVYAYKIKQAYYISATRTDLLNPVKGDPAVSLFTCDQTGAGRVFVRGRLEWRGNLSTTSPKIKKMFKK